MNSPLRMSFTSFVGSSCTEAVAGESCPGLGRAGTVCVFVPAESCPGLGRAGAVCVFVPAESCPGLGRAGTVCGFVPGVF